MRLLEPLNGLKLSQGHWWLHLIMFVFMFTFDPNEVIIKPLDKANHATDGEHHGDGADGHHEEGVDGGHHRLLAGGGGGHHEEELTWE